MCLPDGADHGHLLRATWKSRPRHGDWSMPLVGMFVYATVFALPFVVLAAVPHWLSRLPRAGSWLALIKRLTGLLEVAAAMKFIANADMVWHWNILTRGVLLVVW